MLDFKCLNDDEDDDASHTLPRDTPIASTQMFTNSHQTEGETTRFTSDLDEPPYMTSIMPVLAGSYASATLPSGRSSSQELHRLEDLDNGIVGGVSMGTSLSGMGMSGGDLDLANQQPWQSQNSNSQSQVRNGGRGILRWAGLLWRCGIICVGCGCSSSCLSWGGI